MKLPSLEEADLKGKRVFLRADIDVPLVVGNDGQTKVGDAARLEALKLTISYLQSQDCQIIIAGHLGRPGGKVVPELSVKPVADWFFENKLPQNEKFKILENLRFNPGEENNDEAYAKELTSLADVYVNESFANCERAHASMVGVPKILPHFAGYRLLKEVDVLSTIIDVPRRPLIVVVGGAKLETKLPVISKMAEWADRVVVGGELLREVKECVPKVLYLTLAPNGRDTTIESIDQVQIILSYAATIVWNGPVGYIEDPTYQVGTKRLAELIAANVKAFKVVGGGDTIGFLNRLGLTNRFDWVSTGGGSMLKFLGGEKLPGVEALLV